MSKKELTTNPRKMDYPSIAKPMCDKCGEKSSFFGCETPECKKIAKKKLKAEIAQYAKDEKVRRAVPVTVGDVEDMIEEALSNITIDAGIIR
tara:strand:- start:45 stop:320 length:276 start_codon:yes stop_codon:yes gene_type:complete